MEDKKALISLFETILWKDRKNYDPEKAPWEDVKVLDSFQLFDGSFLVIAKRSFQTLHNLADYETFEYSEVYLFNKKVDKFIYQLLCRVLYLHNYTYDGFRSIYNTRRYENKDLFHDPNKKFKQIIADMKFLSESGNEIILKRGYIEKRKNFKYLYRLPS